MFNNSGEHGSFKSEINFHISNNTVPTTHKKRLMLYFSYIITFPTNLHTYNYKSVNSIRSLNVKWIFYKLYLLIALGSVTKKINFIFQIYRNVTGEWCQDLLVLV